MISCIRFVAVAMNAVAQFLPLAPVGFIVTTAAAQQSQNDLFARLDAYKFGKVPREEFPENQEPVSETSTPTTTGLYQGRVASVNRTKLRTVRQRGS